MAVVFIDVCYDVSIIMLIVNLIPFLPPRIVALVIWQLQSWLIVLFCYTGTLLADSWVNHGFICKASVSILNKLYILGKHQ